MELVYTHNTLLRIAYTVAIYYANLATVYMQSDYHVQNRCVGIFMLYAYNVHQ